MRFATRHVALADDLERELGLSGVISSEAKSSSYVELLITRFMWSAYLRGVVLETPRDPRLFRRHTPHNSAS
jgi:hypothetical protein